MIQFKIIFSMGATEVADSGIPGDFVNLVDSETGLYVGIKYDIDNVKFIVFQGSNTIEIPQAMVADQLAGFTINIFAQGNDSDFAQAGTLKIDAYHGGTYFGTITTDQVINIDTLRVGALHTTGEAIDRKISFIRVGSAPGLEDVFTDGGFVGDTVAPPFDSVVGTTITASEATGAMSVSNGGANAYAQVALTVVSLVTQTEIAIVVDPNKLHFVGDSDWKQSGPRRWHRDGWELDRLIIPVRGSINTIDDYLNTLPLWGSLADSPDMFLADYPSDDHKQFPTLQLTFTGKRGGVLPPPRSETSSSIQQTSGIVFSDSFILTFGLPPHWQAKITYISQVSRITLWSRTKPNFDEISPPSPSDITPADITSLVIGGIDYSVWTLAAPHYNDIVAWVLRWFFQRSATYTSSQEVVPNQYHRAVVTSQVLLLPVQEEIVT